MNSLFIYFLLEENNPLTIQPLILGGFFPCSSIAWAEIKLILCKMFWTFDLQLAENNVDDWTDQKVWLLSERLPLNVKVGLRV